MKKMFLLALISSLAFLSMPFVAQAQPYPFRPTYFPEHSSGYLGPYYTDSPWYSQEYWKYHARSWPIQPYQVGRTTSEYYSPSGSKLRSLSARSGIPEDRAVIRVLVPNADTQVWIDDHLSSETGTERGFRSPPLELGTGYYYQVRAIWTENGREVDRERRVRVQAGRRSTVDFRTVGDARRELRTRGE